MFDLADSMRKEQLYMENAKRQMAISKLLDTEEDSNKREVLIKEFNECGKYTGVYWN